MVAATIVTSLSFINRMETLQQQRVGAYELATRLLLIHLDDPKNLPDPSTAYYDGTFYFRWQIDQVALKIELPSDAVLEPQSTGPGAAAATQGKLLMARVWSARADGVGGFVPVELMADVRRLHNPMTLFSRNYNSTERLLKDMPRALAVLQGLAGNGGTPSGGPRPPGSGASGSGGNAGSGSGSGNAGDNSATGGSAGSGRRPSSPVFSSGSNGTTGTAGWKNAPGSGGSSGPR